MPYYIVHDGVTGDVDESGGLDIHEHAHSLVNILKQNSVAVKSIELDNWETTGSKRTTGNENNKVVYITSIESENFHTKVKQVFIKGKSNCMVVLQHSQNEEHHVDRFKASVKKSMKKQEPNKMTRKILVQEILERIVAVTDVKKVSLWLPKVLKFLLQVPGKTNRDRYVREIGVYFKINWDDEHQVEWLQRQKYALEDVFRIRCRHNGNFMNEDMYISRSTCVVMYADRTTYHKLPTDDTRREGKKKLLNSINETRAACKIHATTFHVFFDQAGVKLTNVLANDYYLKLVGNGMIHHWIGLLSMLGIVRVKRVRDNTFYTQKLVSEENELEVFDQGPYEQFFKRRAETAASTSGVNLLHAGSVDQVSYQSMDDVVNDDDVANTSVICCTRLLSLNI